MEPDQMHSQDEEVRHTNKSWPGRAGSGSFDFSFIFL
jgi:hypothetical protein